MKTMTSTDFNPAKRRVGRRRRHGVPSSPAPAGPLLLVAATYDADGPKATLTFDRAVNVDAFDGTQITVNDPIVQAATFNGAGGAVLVSPTTVDVMLTNFDLPSGSVITMSATGMTGIVAVDDGGAWAGATDMELPFP